MIRKKIRLIRLCKYVSMYCNLRCLKLEVYNKINVRFCEQRLTTPTKTITANEIKLKKGKRTIEQFCAMLSGRSKI